MVEDFQPIGKVEKRNALLFIENFMQKTENKNSSIKKLTISYWLCVDIHKECNSDRLETFISLTELPKAYLHVLPLRMRMAISVIRFRLFSHVCN